MGKILLILIIGFSAPVLADQNDLPDYLKDRGTGIPTSLSGTYIGKGEMVVYPFFEYYRDHDLEYDPREFGFQLEQEFRGKYRAYEGLIFPGYGVTDWLLAELEASVITASLPTAPEDTSGLPDQI